MARTALDILSVAEFKTAIRSVGSDPDQEHFMAICIAGAVSWISEVTGRDLLAMSRDEIPNELTGAIILHARQTYDMEDERNTDAILNLIAPYRVLRVGGTEAPDDGDRFAFAAELFWSWSDTAPAALDGWRSVGAVANDGTFCVPHAAGEADKYWSLWHPATVERLVSAVIVEPPTNLLTRSFAEAAYELNGAAGQSRQSMAPRTPSDFEGATVRVHYALAMSG